MVKVVSIEIAADNPRAVPLCRLCNNRRDLPQTRLCVDSGIQVRVVDPQRAEWSLDSSRNHNPMAGVEYHTVVIELLNLNIAQRIPAYDR